MINKVPLWVEGIKVPNTENSITEQRSYEHVFNFSLTRHGIFVAHQRRGEKIPTIVKQFSSKERINTISLKDSLVVLSGKDRSVTASINRYSLFFMLLRRCL